MGDKAYLVTYRKQNEKVILKELFKDKERAIEILWDKLAEVSSDNVADTNDYDEIYEHMREMLQRESLISVDDGDYTVSKKSNMFLGDEDSPTYHFAWRLRSVTYSTNIDNSDLLKLTEGTYVN